MIETKIYDYEVSFEKFEDGVTGCWINYGDYSGSLEFALCNGLVDNFENYHVISEHILNKIEEWAHKQGY
jgi:hypothetical protein